MAANVELAAGDEVLVLEDHYANALPWQHAATRAGASLVALARPSPALEGWGGGRAPVGRTTAALLAAIGPRTKV
eukprot:COSAG04_NODE_5948_length_1449_cov_1.091852_2_plen_74_part_01